MKRIVVVCGCGIATSTIVYYSLEEFLEKNKIKAYIIQCKISEVASIQQHVDLILSTTLLPIKYDVPVLNAMEYIIGEEIEALEEKILNILMNV